MNILVENVERTVESIARSERLAFDMVYEDIFTATVNSKLATGLVVSSAVSANLWLIDKPFPWSEDFGQFTAKIEGALIGIGAGEDVPPLHNPEYDFPDEVIPHAVEFLIRKIEDACRN